MSQRNDHIDSFEQFLKETTESFRMTPSRKVWTSIYNNIHPRRIWPSFSTSMILLFCLLFLQVPQKIKVVENHTSNKITVRKNHNSTKVHFSSIEKNSRKQKSNGIKNVQSLKNVPSRNGITTTLDCLSDFTTNATPAFLSDAYDNRETRSLQYRTNLNKENKKDQYRNGYMVTTANIRNRKSQSYLFQVYATPGFGYSQAYEKEQNGNNGVGNTLSVAGNSTDVGNNMRSTLNLEAGGAVLMNVSKIVRLKAGMQVNYTHIDDNNPESNSTNGNALVGSSLGYNNNALFQRDNNRISDADLYQISLPIGSEIELMGNEKFKWYAGATVQPSYLMNAESQDETALTSRDALFGLRKWNLNSSIETYVSYKMRNGVILNIGPQFRYQWLSTYNQPLMSGMDRLYNIGLKLGISGNF